MSATFVFISARANPSRCLTYVREFESRASSELPGATSPYGGLMSREYYDDPELPFEVALYEAAIAYMEHCGFIHNYENGTFSNDFLQHAESAYWAAAKVVRLPVQPANQWESDKPTRKALSGKLRTAVYERDEYACVRCGSRKSLQVDHIHPVLLGGTNDLDNLQTLCKSCNSAKGARVPCPG